MIEYSEREGANSFMAVALCMWKTDGAQKGHLRNAAVVRPEHEADWSIQGKR